MKWSFWKNAILEFLGISKLRVFEKNAFFEHYTRKKYNINVVNR